MLLPISNELFFWTHPFVEMAIAISFLAMMIAYGGASCHKRKDEEKG